MVKKVDKGTIIVLDVGKNVAESDEKDKKSFFEKSRECVARIIERKILSQGKDYLGIILIGSKKTLNNMAEQCDGVFRNIETLVHLQPPTWKMIKDLPASTSKKSADWVEALAVAVDHVKNEVSGVSIKNVKIILMTNFQTLTSSTKNVQMVLDGIKNENIAVDVIGPDIQGENIKSSELEWANQFVKETNGQTATFHETMNYLAYHRKKPIKPLPWNVDLSIGPYIKIPVTAYVRLQDDNVVEKWKKSIKDPVTSKSSTTEGIIKNPPAFYNVENQSKVDKADVTKCHEFGGQSVLSSDSDKSALYKPGDKSLSLYGFTLASNIHWQHLDGKGLLYLFGRKGDKKSQQAIACLTEILHEKKLVGIVRKVHNNNNAPKMFALIPVIDVNYSMCLAMICLCYKEAIKYMLFPPTNIRKYTCTVDQVNAFKNLIRTMDLNNAYDSTFDDVEAFPFGETVSPAAQYLLDCIAYRALNPDKPLPQPRDDIMNLFKIPPLIEERSREAQEKIKKIFLLQNVEKTKRKPKRLLQVETDHPSPYEKPDDDDTTKLKIKLPKPDAVNDNKISTIDPVRDLSSLINKGKTLNELAPEMSEVIESLIYFNLDGTYKKAIASVTYFRNECVKMDPSIYNNWLLKFKVDLTNRNRSDIHCLIKNNGIDFILKSENNLSTFETIDCHEESQLYEMDTVPESTEIVIKPEVNAMFDEI